MSVSDETTPAEETAPVLAPVTMPKPVAKEPTDDAETVTTTTVTETKFADRGLRPSILAVLEKKGFTTPTPIQALTFQHFSGGHHIVGQSQTGSGKTAAFLLPILNVMNLKEAAPQVLVLAPTRELALQTEEEVFELTRGLFGAKSCLVCGGMSYFKQKQRVQGGANIIVGTPGRILEMLEKKIIQTNQLKYFVLDEVDRMLDMGFSDEVEAIWSLLPHHMQVMCFSATMPHELIRMFEKHLEAGYQHIQIAKEQTLVRELDHAFMRVSEMQKLPTLEAYLQRHDFQKVVVFAQTKRAVGELYDALRINGYLTMELHGDIDQYGRMKATREFKTSTKVILVATDVASRGLNFNDVDLVINFDMPQDPEDYVHRVGRTARAGKSGKALMFVTPSEVRKLSFLERANKMQIKEIDAAGNIVPRQPESSRGGTAGGRGGYSGGSRRRQPRGDSRRTSYGDRKPGGYGEQRSSSHAAPRSGGYGESRGRPYGDQRPSRPYGEQRADRRNDTTGVAPQRSSYSKPYAPRDGEGQGSRPARPSYGRDGQRGGSTGGYRGNGRPSRPASSRDQGASRFPRNDG